MLIHPDARSIPKRLLYLCHAAVLLFWAPARHFVPEGLQFFYVAIAALILSVAVVRVEHLLLRDGRIMPALRKLAARVAPSLMRSRFP